MISGPPILVTDHDFDQLAELTQAADRSGFRIDVLGSLAARDIEAAVRGRRVVLTQYGLIDEGVIRALGPGGVVIRYGIGVDNIDLGAAARLGVAVANIPDYGPETVADHTLALALSIMRQLPQASTAMRERGWILPQDLRPMKALADVRAGIIGFGRIGRLVASRLSAFGMDVLFTTPRPTDSSVARQVELSELLATSDLISLHTPLSAGTRHLIDQTAFEEMREGVHIVNTSRGALIDTAELIRRLESGAVAAAAIDVFENEPLAPTDPILAAPNLLVTPHLAAASVAARARLEALAAAEAERAVLGRPLRSPVSLRTPVGSADDSANARKGAR